MRHRLTTRSSSTKVNLLLTNCSRHQQTTSCQQPVLSISFSVRQRAPFQNILWAAFLSFFFYRASWLRNCKPTDQVYFAYLSIRSRYLSHFIEKESNSESNLQTSELSQLIRIDNWQVIRVISHLLEIVTAVEIMNVSSTKKKGISKRTRSRCANYTLISISLAAWEN